MTIIVNSKVHVHIRDNYKEPIDVKFDDCTLSSEILKKLVAEDSSDSKSNAVENQTKKVQNMKLRHVARNKQF